MGGFLRAAEDPEKVKTHTAMCSREALKDLRRLWGELKDASDGVDGAIVSVDKDGIITAHVKACVWPYDDENTAVQADTDYGYVLVRVQRFDRQ